MLIVYNQIGAALARDCDVNRLLSNPSFHYKGVTPQAILQTTSALTESLMSEAAPTMCEAASMEVDFSLVETATCGDESFHESLFWSWMLVGIAAQHGLVWQSMETGLSRAMLVISFAALSVEFGSLSFKDAMDEIRQQPAWTTVLAESTSIAEAAIAACRLIDSRSPTRSLLAEILLRWRHVASGYSKLTGLTAEDAEAAGWLCLEQAI